jgi:hypothetical protein
MTANKTKKEDNSLVKSTLDWIADVGINGMGLLPCAEDVAADYLSKAASVEDAINSLIAWRTVHAAGTGFITGIGGVATLPVTIPVGLASSYALGASTTATVAYLRGYDIHSEKVRTMILLSLIGEAGEEVLKTTGIVIGNNLCKNVIKQIPGKTLKEINKKVGFRLVTKAGEKGAVNLTKMVPLVGGFVGASFDGMFVKSCGETAKTLFT